MDTNDLIAALTQDLKPVKPLAAPPLRALTFTAAALLVVLALLFLGGARAGWPMSAGIEAALMTIAGISSAVAAFYLAVPDTRLRRMPKLLLALAVLIWAGLCLYAFTMMPAGALREEPAALSCVIGLVAMSVVPVALGTLMVWRGSPVWRGMAGGAVWLSAASFGAAGMRFLCANDGLGHLLLWHFAPVLALAALGAYLGRFLLKRL